MKRKFETIVAGCLLTGLVISLSLLLIVWLLNIPLLGIPYWSAHVRWERADFRNYMITITEGTPLRMSNVTLEIVEDGRREIRTDGEMDEPTIDRMFRSIRECMGIPLGFLLCEIAYDEEYGYPTRYAQHDLDLGPDIIEVLDFEPTQ